MSRKMCGKGNKNITLLCSYSACGSVVLGSVIVIDSNYCFHNYVPCGSSIIKNLPIALAV
jgi:hypothetical protein